MYKKLSETKCAVNEFRVDSIKKVLSKFQRITKIIYLKMMYLRLKRIDIVERILYVNQLELAGKGLTLSRLPISLAQLKAGNNSEKLKNEIRQLLHSLYRSKKLTKISIKVWLTLFKHGNNLYEH